MWQYLGEIPKLWKPSMMADASNFSTWEPEARGYVNPTDLRTKTPPIQIMVRWKQVVFYLCVCVCKHAYVYVYGLSLFKMGFKRSSMDMGKIRVFIAQEWGVSKWGSSRQTVGVTEAEHSYNKLVRGLDFSLGEVSLQAQTHQRAPGWQSSWNPLPNPFPAACWGIGEFGCLFLLWKKEIPLSSETCMKDPHCHLVAWFFFNDTSTLPLPYCCLSMANNSSLHVSVSFCLFVLFLRQWLSSPSFLELSM